MALATLTIDINAKLGNIERDLGRVSHLAEQSGQRMASAFNAAQAAFAAIGAGLSVAAFTAGIKSVIDGADQLQKASQKYGVAVEQLSALQYAGKLSDVSLEAIGTGLKKLSVNMLDTAAGTGEAKDAFKALGIGVKDATGGLKSSDAVLAEIADKFAGMEDGAGKTALAVKLFGKAGADLIPLLNAGSRGLAEMKAEAEKLGVIVGGDLVRKSEQFNDNLTRMAAALDAGKIALTGGIIEKLVEITDALVAASKASDGFWKGLLLLGGDQASNPVKALEEVEARLASLKKLKGEIEGSAANKSAFRDLPIIGTAGDLKDLEKQIAFAEKQRVALLDLANKRGAFEFGPPVMTTKGKPPGSPATGAGTAKTPGGSIDDLESRINQRVGAAITGSDLAKAQEYALALDALDRLFFEGGLDAEIYASAIDKLSGASDKAATAQDRLSELLAATPTAKLEESRKDMELLVTAFEGGRINAEQFIEAAQTRLGTLGDGIKETNDLARDLGLTFQSAFEDAVIAGKKFSDVLKGLAQDIARIILRKTVTEPLGNFVGDMLKGLIPSFGGGKAAGGAVYPGQYYVVGENGPEVLVPGTSGTVIPNGAAGGVVNNVSIVVNAEGDSRVQSDAAQGAELGRRLEGAVRAVLLAERRPGGLLAGG